MRTFWFIFFGWLVCVNWQAKAAPPTLSHFFPSGGMRGNIVDVTASGKFSHWPAKIRVDRSGLTFETAEASGKLKVAIDKEADAGVYWIRMYDEEGAAKLCPFVVGTLPELVETEPNDNLDNTQLIEGNAVINGRFAKSGEVDVFTVKLRKDQMLVASMDASRSLGSPMDAVLQVCDAKGFVIAQNDDSYGTDPLIVFRALQDGLYMVRGFAFPATPNSTINFAGGENFIYRLTLTTGGFVDHVMPMTLNEETTEVRLFGWNIPDELSNVAMLANHDREFTAVFHPLLANCLALPASPHRVTVANASSSPAEPQPIDLPAKITGRIESASDVDTFAFSGKKGQKLSFRAEADSLGYQLDPVLRLADATGKLIKEVDDVSKRRDPDFVQAIPADGHYTISINDINNAGGFRYVYRLTIEEAKPDFALLLTADSFVLTPGELHEVPIAIERKNGFSEEIEITLEGLPEHVKVKSVKSLAKGTSAKKVTLKLSSDNGPFSGPFQIVGKSSGDDNVVKKARFDAGALSVSFTDAWLTVLKPDDK